MCIVGIKDAKAQRGKPENATKMHDLLKSEVHGPAVDKADSDNSSGKARNRLARKQRHNTVQREKQDAGCCSKPCNAQLSALNEKLLFA